MRSVCACEDGRNSQKAAWPSGQIRNPAVPRSSSAQPGFVLGRPEFKYLATLVNGFNQDFSFHVTCSRAHLLVFTRAFSNFPP